jgi:hypothetical protein
VQQWGHDANLSGVPHNDEHWAYEQHIAIRAARWGADQELEACCEWLVSEGWFKYEHEAVEDLRASRRPKPPSLKEQALMGLSRIESTGEFFSDGMKDLATIRRALEALPDD